MKKILLVLLSVIVFSSFSKAQLLCNPDQFYADSSFGVYPKILPPLVPGQPYDQTITVKTVTDTLFYFQGIPVDVRTKAMKILEVNGLPPGFEVLPLYNDPFGFWVNYGIDTTWFPVLGCIAIHADAAAVDAVLSSNPNGGNFQLEYKFDAWVKGNPIPATYTWISTLGTPPGLTFDAIQYLGGMDSCGYHFNIANDTMFYETDFAGLPATAGSYDMQITSVANCDWSISNACSWITASPSTGADLTSTTFTYEANTTGEPRYCNFTIGGRTYRVTQISDECTINMEVPNGFMGPLEQTTYIYVWAADTCYWSIMNRAFCDWINISPTSGTGNDTLVVHVDPNNTSENRQCEININGTTITLNQLTTALTENQAGNVQLYPNPAADLVNISLPQTGEKIMLSIYNTAGQLITQQQLTAQNNQVSTAALANGMYLFVVQNNDGIIARKRIAVSK